MTSQKYGGAMLAATTNPAIWLAGLAALAGAAGAHGQISVLSANRFIEARAEDTSAPLVVKRITAPPFQGPTSVFRESVAAIADLAMAKASQDSTIFEDPSSFSQFKFVLTAETGDVGTHEAEAVYEVKFRPTMPSRFVMSGSGFGHFTVLGSVSLKRDGVSVYEFSKDEWFHVSESFGYAAVMVPGSEYVLTARVFSKSYGVHMNLTGVVDFLPTCLPDCTGDGVLNIQDFTCFQNAFALGNIVADVGGASGCEPDGQLTIADFTCFQNLFALGCP